MAGWKITTPNKLQLTTFRFQPRRFVITSVFAFMICVLVFEFRGSFFTHTQRDVSWLIFRLPEQIFEGVETSTTKHSSTQSSVEELLFGEPTVGGSHIIFMETSCCLEDIPAHTPYDSASGLRMTPRAACAMTAAARLHPERLVYYLHTCRINRTALAHGEAPPFALSVLANRNFRLWDTRYKDAFIDTPLRNWSMTDALRKSRYPVSHGSDALRFAVLWKYGGTYLDTDVLMYRSIGMQRDFTCPESKSQISVGAMDMSLSDVGRRVANMCVEEVRDHFKPLDWNNNGPGTLSRVLNKLCGISQVPKMTPELCKGFNMLPTSTFYPIHFSRWKLFFQEKDAASTMKKLEKSLGIHMWNKLSFNETIFTNSSQPYAQLARKVCPSVVTALNGTM